MRIPRFVLAAALSIACQAGEARTVKKASNHPAPRVRSTASAARSTSTHSKRSTASHRSGRSRRFVSAAPPRPRAQSEPEPERYREIQQALADKGYLKSVPSGAWDRESQSAMQRFQADRKTDVTGKIDSQSLIGLGLGPKSAGATAGTTPSGEALK